MSEYQYYEFQAIDRPLGEADRAELQALSSRARVTSTSFTNHYNYGDFRGDPRKLVERWFDLHLYLANWGTRRLMIRLPKRFLDPSRIEVFLHEVEWVEAWESGENLIVDMHFRDEESAYGGWEEGEGWLGALASLRADLLAGDLRLFHLLWLTAAQAGDLSDDEREPLPGLGPLNGALDVQEEKTRRMRLGALAARGAASVWREVETEIEKAECRRLRAVGRSAPRPPGAGRGGWVDGGVLGTRSIASRSA